ncbi:MAG TPA: orotate phosphoribosyltransferase [Bacteroidota bacterium]|nr:orotate phosphoribosyltransferase [Bacteroidota bacterium]
MTRDEILSLFRRSGALLEGHFRLTSGLHSPHYFQCARVLQYPANTECLCREIAEKFRVHAADVVVAPALGGIVVGQEVGRQLNVRSIFTERKDGSMQLRRGFEIASGERVLVCEDVITTGGSVNEVLEIVKQRGADVIGVGAIVDRSGGKAVLPGFFATLTMDVLTYAPGECPSCKQGIPVETPGSRQ